MSEHNEINKMSYKSVGIAYRHNDEVIKEFSSMEGNCNLTKDYLEYVVFFEEPPFQIRLLIEITKRCNQIHR